MLDIDHFKRVNDTHGHDIGDEVLISISKLISNSLRSKDAFIRFGGEEFFIFTSDCNLKITINIAEKFRLKIQNTKHGSLNLNITSSFGVVEYIENETMESLIKRCDLLLYKAKANGRNIVISTQES